MSRDKKNINPGIVCPFIIHFIYVLFFLSIVFSWRAISSISIAALLAAGIIATHPNYKKLFTDKNNLLWIGGCTIYILLVAFSLVYTRDLSQGLSALRTSSGLMAVPLAVIFAPALPQRISYILKSYSIVLLSGVLFCLYKAGILWLQTGNLNAFFYHELVRPLNQHAVYFSILVLIALIILIENLVKKIYWFHKTLHLVMIAFFTIALFLLSSKYAIAAFLLYMVIRLFKQLQLASLGQWTALTMAGFAFLVVSISLNFNTPVRQRFSDILNGNLRLVNRESFDPGIYFNGLQFRLLQWRLVPDILTKEKRWLYGTSPGDAQVSQDNWYRSKNMYTGNPETGDPGYLGYNTHNQFLQTTLQNGIPGLAALLIICIAMLRSINWPKRPASSAATLVLLGWMFTESIFETQYGIIIFCFFPGIIRLSENSVIDKKQINNQV